MLAPLTLLLNRFCIIFIAVQLLSTGAESNFTVYNTTEIILMNDSESNGIEIISGWVVTTFIVSGVIITFWSLCIFGLSMFLIKIYYQRRKKEILLRNKNYSNNDNIDNQTIEMNINTLNILSETESEESEQENDDEGIHENDKKHKIYKIRYGDNNAYYPDNNNMDKDDIPRIRGSMYNHHGGISNDTTCTISKDSAETMNTSKIIQQTDGMDTARLAVIIHSEDAESRCSDDDIYVNPNNNNKRLKPKYNKLNGKRKQIGFNGEEKDGNYIHIHTQSINMEESHDDQNHDRNLSVYTISNQRKRHYNKIMSDHYMYPSLPSFSGIRGGHIHVPSNQSAFSAIYENCVTPDGFIFVGTNRTFGNQQHHQNQITATPTYQLPKYAVTKGQWM